jgi:hypothetical protein
MKRFAPFVFLAVTLAAILTPFALAASAASRSPGDRSPGAPVATAISTVTGIAISPLLGTAAFGAYQWASADGGAARAALPWYAQMKFWLPALLVVGAVAAKDAFGAAVPTGMKKPLDVLETIENKLSGLVAAGAVIPFAIGAMAKILAGNESALAQPVSGAGGLAMIQLSAVDMTWLINLLTVPFGIAVFVVVWLASHAINVLILLSPWGAIDGALKAARTSLLGLVTAAAVTDPRWGAAFSVVVIIVAYFIAGWSFRLMVFGSIFSWEFVTRRCRRFKPQANGNRMFAGANFTEVPVRTYGRLERRPDGSFEFVYKPWLVLKEQRTAVPVERESLAVGIGLFFSDMIAADGRTLFVLPPRYRGHEEALVRGYELGGGIRDAGLRRAWSSIREMIGGRAMRAPQPEVAGA